MQRFKQLFFTDASPIIKAGRSTILQADKYVKLPKDLDPSYHNKLEYINLEGPWAFLRGVVVNFKGKLSLLFVFAFVSGIIQVLIPLLIQQLLLGLEKHLEFGEARSAMVWLTWISLATIGQSLLDQQYIYRLSCLKMNITSAYRSLVYDRCLSLSKSGLEESGRGDLVNLVECDAPYIGDFIGGAVGIFHSFMILMGVVIGASYLLGPESLLSLGVFIVFLPLLRIVASRMMMLDEDILDHCDERIDFLSQVVKHIRLIKNSAWEPLIRKEMSQRRNPEFKLHKKMVTTYSVSVFLFNLAQFALVLAALGIYLALGKELNVPTVVAILALFLVLQEPFEDLADRLGEIVQGRVSAKRIIEFLDMDFKESRASQPPVPGVDLSLENYSVTFDEKTALNEINLSVQSGELIGIVGPVGAGKSTLLLAILGEVEEVEGKRSLPADASIAWISQDPVILNRRLEENVMMAARGKRSLDEIAEACALSQDILQMPAGWATEIGEKGVNLSGGQKQRISLAKAMASDPQIILADDPFSALNRNTESILMERLVQQEWKGKTRVIATHSLHHLDKFDRIVFLTAGAVRGVGTLQQLKATCPDFVKFLSRAVSENEIGVVDEEYGFDRDKKGYSGVLIAQEDREEGSVSLGVYWEYLKWMAGGRFFWAFALASTIIMASILPVLADIWLTMWSGEAAVPDFMKGLISDKWIALSVLAAIYGASVFCAWIQTFVWTYRAIAAGKDIHFKAFMATLYSPIRFFSTTPHGRILNRFSHDMDELEGEMPWSFQDTFQSIMDLILALVLVLVVVPIALPILFPVAFVYRWLQRGYRSTARETRRLFAIANSNFLSHFTETLDSLLDLRSYNLNAAFSERARSLLSDFQKLKYANYLADGWFAARIGIVSSLSSLAIGCGLIFMAENGLLTITLAGIVMLYTRSVCYYLHEGVRSYGVTEAHMTSAERLMAWTSLPAEEGADPNEKIVDYSGNLSSGEICFEGVTMRYGSRLPTVLKDVNLKIPSGSKVGIVGRTGSGKSSLFQCLTRIVPVEQGRILVGGTSILDVPLSQLRQWIAIIPQDPSLFDGTLRSNLDRLERYDDKQIWQVLEKVHLKELFQERGLDAPILDGGGNLSRGQRQLIGLARALLSSAKIIAIDEATASVDLQTEKMIQDVLYQEFEESTVLMIAHRLETLSRVDILIEMADGKVVSVDRPKKV